jgi:kynureninase
MTQLSSQARARALDAADPLARFRDAFVLPDPPSGVDGPFVYLDGNSLGALPRHVPARMEQAVRDEWGEGLIGSWNTVPGGGEGWITLPMRVGGAIAPLIGAREDEVVACDSTSVNLFKLIAAALQMRPGRKVILSEPGNFPTDLYMIAGLEAQGLATRRLAARDALAGALDDDVALLMLTHVHYKTGAVHDMAALTAAAHDAGALVLWDLSHSTGAVPVDLAGVNADFAVGCGYKYLNGGPGAPAFAYVARRHHAEIVQPLTGWMGHARPFDFEDDYAPAPGMKCLLAGTPPVLGLIALEAGVDLVRQMGIDALWAKSRALSEFFLDVLGQTELALVSPADARARGSQLSFRHDDAYAICQALIARGITGDFRAPDILRLGFAPAYLRFSDIAHAAEVLRDVLATRAWDRDEYRQRSAVT